jgi:hypothetical protein
MNGRFSAWLSSRGSLLCVAAIALWSEPLTAAAQDTTTKARSDWLVAGSFGVPGAGSDAVPELMTVAVQWTQMRPGRLGGDFSLGTAPRILVEGALAMGLRAGVALPLELSRNLFLLPSGGVSLLTLMSDEAGAGVAGWNTGVAAVVLGRSSVGLRTGITWHRFQDSSSAVWLAEFGIASVPPGSRR